MSTSQSSAHDIVITIDTIDQLFNAPAINPFSHKQIDVLGESAMTRVRRQLLARPPRNWDEARFVVEMPRDQITPGLQEQTSEALRRYIDAKIEDNQLSIKLSRTLGLTGLLIVIGVSVVLLTLTTLLLAGPFAGLDDEWRGFVLGFVSIFVWVMLWDPLSKLLFEWVQPSLENRILQGIRAMPLVIKPQV